MGPRGGPSHREDQIPQAPVGYSHPPHTPVMATPIQYGQYRVPPATEMVNFGVGQPAPGLLPLDRVRASAAAKFSEEDPLFLQYGYISGYPLFRKTLSTFLSSKYGKPVDPELLFTTTGVTGALALIASLFVSRGDVVLSENPSYFLALNIFRDFGLRIVPIPLDANGIDTVALEAMLEADPTLRPKFLYTIPAYQNPTGYNMSESRKTHLVRLAAKYDFMVLADEVYQLLGFTDAPPPSPPLCYYDTPEVVGGEGQAGHVFSIGSFAKILAPGMRLGWLQTSPSGAPLLKRLFDCGQLDSSGAVNPVISGIVQSFIDLGHGDEHLTAVRTELTGRARVLCDALTTHLPPGAQFNTPSGGYFVWIKLPHPAMTGAALLDFCVAKHAVRFQPGERFGTGLDNFIRLSFSYYPREDLALGAQRLGKGMGEFLAIVAAGGGAPSPSLAAGAAPTPVVLGVHGASGRLGSLIMTAAAAAAGAAAPATSGGKVWKAEALGRGNVGGPSLPSVIVDVSLPQGTAALVASLLALPTSTPSYPALVVGTTGSDLPKEALKAYSAKAPVVVCANFSTGVPLLLKVLGGLKGSLPAGWHGEVTEMHHTAKLDAPSGTGKRIQGALEVAGVTGFGGVSPPPCHALRLGDTIGTHTVHLAGPGERLEITHTATRRDVFATGALRVAEWAATLKPSYQEI